MMIPSAVYVCDLEASTDDRKVSRDSKSILRSFEEPAFLGGDDGGVSRLRSGKRGIDLSMLGDA